jgi:hypothetical protein
MRNPAMKRFRIIGLIGMLVATSPTNAGAPPGPGEAEGGRRRDQAGPSLVSRADYVVLVWYRRADPLATFQYQVYDVRKGEYTQAVEDWVKHVRCNFSAYTVLVRDVDLRKTKGDTEKLKVGSVIQRELLVAAAGAGVVPGAPLTLGPGPSRAGRARPPSGGRMVAPADRSFLNPVPTTPSLPIYPRTRPP